MVNGMSNAVRDRERLHIFTGPIYNLFFTYCVTSDIFTGMT